MNKIFLVFAFLSSLLVNSQTAESIIESHFKNNGGVENWNQLNSILLEGEVSVDVSDLIPIKVEHTRPNFKRMSYIIDGKEQLSEGYDGKNAYTFNPINGKFKNLENYQADAFETDILNYKKKGFKAEYMGIEKLNGIDTYKVKLIKNTVIDYYWFRTSDYQLIQDQNDTETCKYSDFRKAGKLNFAYRMECKPPSGKEYIILFHKIVPNAAINEQRFKFQ